MLRVMKHQNTLLREVVEAPFLETLEIRLDGDSEPPDLVRDGPAPCRAFGAGDS